MRVGGGKMDNHHLTNWHYSINEERYYWLNF
jgi:hypothetical protein